MYINTYMHEYICVIYILYASIFLYVRSYMNVNRKVPYVSTDRYYQEKKLMFNISINNWINTGQLL